MRKKILHKLDKKKLQRKHSTAYSPKTKTSMLRKRPNNLYRSRSSSDGSLTTDHHNNHKNDDYDGSKGKTSNIPRLLIVFLLMIMGAIGIVEYWNPKSLQDFGRGLEASMSEASVRGALTNGNSSSGSDQVHVIFSTDCSAFQHWQSYLVAFSAYQVCGDFFLILLVTLCVLIRIFEGETT